MVKRGVKDMGFSAVMYRVSEFEKRCHRCHKRFRVVSIYGNASELGKVPFVAIVALILELLHKKRK